MITFREMLEHVVAGTITEADAEVAAHKLAKMDESNEKRRNTVSKKAQENAPIVEAIVAVLEEEPKTAAEIGAEVGISTQKASALLRQLVEAGRATKTEVKVKGKGAQKAYAL